LCTFLPSIVSLLRVLTILPPPRSSRFSLHDALPISPAPAAGNPEPGQRAGEPAPPHVDHAARRYARHRSGWPGVPGRSGGPDRRSEEHTSELQSRENLVCRLLLEKKKRKSKNLR